MLTQSYHITPLPLFLVILIYGKELNITVKYTFVFYELQHKGL